MHIVLSVEMEEVDVKWCKVWVVVNTFKNKPMSLGTIYSSSTGTSLSLGTTASCATGTSLHVLNLNTLDITPLKVTRSALPNSKPAERYYFLQKTLADKKVQTLEAQEYTAEVSMYEDIGWTSNGGATININNMMGKHNVSTD